MGASDLDILNRYASLSHPKTFDGEVRVFASPLDQCLETVSVHGCCPNIIRRLWNTWWVIGCGLWLGRVPSGWPIADSCCLCS